MIGFLVFGLVVGLLARLFVPGHQHLGLPATLALGVVGSLVGGMLANALGTGDIFELNVLGSVVAVVTAAVIIAVAENTDALRAD